MKPVKFSRGSGCLVRDEFLVIFKGDHVLIYVYVIILGNLCSPRDPLMVQNPTKIQAVHSKMSMEKHRNAYLPYHVQNLQLLRHEKFLVVWMTVNDSLWRARRCSSVESANVLLHPQ